MNSALGRSELFFSIRCSSTFPQAAAALIVTENVQATSGTGDAARQFDEFSSSIFYPRSKHLSVIITMEL